MNAEAQVQARRQACRRQARGKQALQGRDEPWRWTGGFGTPVGVRDYIGEWKGPRWDGYVGPGIRG